MFTLIWVLIQIYYFIYYLFDQSLLITYYLSFIIFVILSCIRSLYHICHLSVKPPLHSECGWSATCGFGACVFLSELSSRARATSCDPTTGEATCPPAAPPPPDQICHGSKSGFVSKVTLDLSQQAVDISPSLLSYLVCVSCL